MGPMITGTMGVSVLPVSKPRLWKPSIIRFVMAHRRSRRSGSASITSMAARTVATADGGMLAEKMRLRAWCCR